MTGQAIDRAIVLGLLVAALIAFVRERPPAVVIVLTLPAILLAAGIVTTREMMTVIGNDAAFTVAAMFVLSAALERTGCIDAVGHATIRLVGARPLAGLAMLVSLATAVSVVINNTPVVVVLTPVAVRLAQHLGIAPSKLLIPLSYAAIFGGTCTLIGTSTNLVVDGVVRALGRPGFGLFEITGFGVVMAALGLLYLLTLGYHLLPQRETFSAIALQAPHRRFLTEIILPTGSRLIGKTLMEARLTNLADARVIDLIRHDDSLRHQIDSVRLEAGDRLIVKAAVGGLKALGDQISVGLAPELGFQEVAQRATVLVEGMIGPASSLVGRRLAEIGLRRRFGTYILAVHRQGANLIERFEQVCLAVGDTLLLEGPPDGIGRLIKAGDLINLTTPTERPLRRRKAPLAIGALLAVVVLAAFEVMPIAGLAFIAVVGLVLTGCLDRQDAEKAIDWRVMIIIYGMLTLGLAMEKTGTAALLAHGVSQAGVWLGPLGMLSLVYFVTSLLTEIISNTAVAVLLTPIAIGLAEALGVDSRPFIVAVMFGASASFATPIGYQTNTLVYSAGGYRYLDFVKVGLPLNLLFWIAATLLIPLFWPLTPTAPPAT